MGIKLINTSPKSLDEIKQEKIEFLNRKCEETILSGFKSFALGEEHFYGFNQYDQMNLTQQLLVVIANPNIDSVIWKTEDAGPLPHTREQFIQLCNDAEMHKRTSIEKYWILKMRVLQATTDEEVRQIIW